MYQIWFQGSRLQHIYPTWEEACAKKDEFVHELIKKHPEEEDNLQQYLGIKEGMKRKTAASEEPTNKKVVESSNKKVKSKVSQHIDLDAPKKIVIPEEKVKDIPAAPIATTTLPSLNVKQVVPQPTLKHNLPPLTEKGVLPPLNKKGVLPPLTQKGVKVMEPPINMKEVSAPIVKEVDSGVENIKTFLSVLLIDGQRTEIEMRVIDIHKLREPEKENHEINITVRYGNDRIPIPLKVFQFNQLYKLLP